MSSEEQTSASEQVFSSSEEDEVVYNSTSKIFLLGFVQKARHNSCLKSITLDLLSNFFIATNSTTPSDTIERHRQLLEKSDILLFFVNEQTLRDQACLLILQYAYLTQIPIVLLRPPMTKLVLSNRDLIREKEIITTIGNVAILRSESGWHLFDESIVDFTLLQDILHAAFKRSLFYDKHDHTRCISQIRHSLHTVIRASANYSHESTTSSSQPHFYLSPSNHSISSAFLRHDESSKRRAKSRSSSRSRQNKLKLDLSLSTGNLAKAAKTLHPVTFAYNENLGGSVKNVLKSPPPPERIPSSVAVSEIDGGEVDELEVSADKFTCPPLTPITPNSRRAPLFSATSQSSSMDRRMSLSCIEDLTNYQRTQYLVFPLRDSAKKPYLLKFPDDLEEEEAKHGGSVWGSDTSLEEEIKLAGTINAGIIVDQMDDSPIQSPAPYLGDLQ